MNRWRITSIMFKNATLMYFQPAPMRHLIGTRDKKNGSRQIKPETKASEKQSEIIFPKHMQKDVPKLSPLHQTSQVEAFHSTINHFAPKMVSFSYHGMHCRLMIAALHFNENSSRPCATIKEGDLQYKISFPKFKHWEYSVRKKSVDPTYDKHIYLLMDDLLVIKQQCVMFIYFYLDINAKSNSLLCTVCFYRPLHFRININSYTGDAFCRKRTQ